MTNLTLEITDIGAQGDGLTSHNGQPVFVSKTAPGDVVEAEVEGDRGTLKNIITPSPERITAPCPHFSKCGGCSLQHVSDAYYRDWKIKKVDAALMRANIKPKTWGEPVFLPAATRRRVTMAAVKKSGRVVMGYNEARSHNLIDIQTCLILEPALFDKVKLLRPFLSRILPDSTAADVTLQLIDQSLDVVFTGPIQDQKSRRFTLEQDEAFGEMMEALTISRLSWRKKDFGPIEPILTRKAVLKKFGSVTVALPPAAFLQASHEAEAALVKLVLGHTKGAAKIADLFSGSGTFAGHMLATGAHVTAIDGDAGAIHALAATKHPNLTAIQRDLFKNPLGEKDLDTFDAVVFDPPRAGAAEQAARLAYSDTRKIIGVSCNPTSFARDAAVLQEGGFQLQSLTLVDQFVWSAHVELVGLFTK